MTFGTKICRQHIKTLCCSILRAKASIILPIFYALRSIKNALEVLLSTHITSSKNHLFSFIIRLHWKNVLYSSTFHVNKTNCDILQDKRETLSEPMFFLLFYLNSKINYYRCWIPSKLSFSHQNLMIVIFLTFISNRRLALYKSPPTDHHICSLSVFRSSLTFLHKKSVKDFFPRK